MSRNAEYQFISTDTEALETLLIAAYEKMTGISVRPASPEKLFIQWVTAIILQERVLNNYTGNQNIPSRAEGNNLDALGELFYTSERPGAKAATCIVRFHISAAQTTSILIPAGTRITDISATLFWETIEDAYLAIGSTYADVQVRCQTPGTVGNGYAAGQINTLVDLFAYCDHCESTTVSDGGSDPASDDEFYELMRESMDAYSTAGPAGAYVFHSKAVSTEISDVKAVRPKEAIEEALPVYAGHAFCGGENLVIESLEVYSHGGTTAAVIDTDYTVSYAGNLLDIALLAGGSLSEEEEIDIKIDNIKAGCVDIYVLMDDGTIATSTIKEAVLAACNDETVRPLTDRVAVKDPETVSYDINLTYYIPANSAESSAEIEAAVTAAVAEYTAWQCARLGRDINPSYLHGLLMQTGIKRAVITSPAFTVLRDGSDNTAPQLAVIDTTTVTNGGQEDE